MLPYPNTDGAVQFAATSDATPASARFDHTAGVSLSPASIRSTVADGISRLVLSSPNGSTISFALSGGGFVVAGCLRNATAVAKWIGDRSVTVVAAGEQWPDGSLLPGVEDLWGAGAILNALGGRDFSPEALAARAAFAAYSVDGLRACATGRELVDMGFPEDVEIAAEIDSSTSVPVLVDGAFT